MSMQPTQKTHDCILCSLNDDLGLFKGSILFFFSIVLRITQSPPIPKQWFFHHTIFHKDYFSIDNNKIVFQITMSQDQQSNSMTTCEFDKRVSLPNIVMMGKSIYKCRKNLCQCIYK